MSLSSLHFRDQATMSTEVEGTMQTIRERETPQSTQNPLHTLQWSAFVPFKVTNRVKTLLNSGNHIKAAGNAANHQTNHKLAEHGTRLADGRRSSTTEGAVTGRCLAGKLYAQQPRFSSPPFKWYRFRSDRPRAP